MGTWGHGLFADDCAQDVRDAYRHVLTQGTDEPEATAALVALMSDTVADPDEGPVFWLALALTQHALGRLQPDVRAHAIAVLDGGLGLARWREGGPKLLAKRLAALHAVRAQLAEPMPTAKRFKPPFRDSSAWVRGDLVAYALTSGQFAVFRVLGTEDHAIGTAPVVELLDGAFATLPTASAVARSPLLARALPAWNLAKVLARHAGGNNPMVALQRVFAAVGLLDAAAAEHSIADALGDGPVLDWVAHSKAVENAVAALKRSDPEAVVRLRSLAVTTQPGLADPISQLSLRRVFGPSERPSKRLTRVGSSDAVSPLGTWLATQWTDLDEVLAEVFDLR